MSPFRERFSRMFGNEPPASPEAEEAKRTSTPPLIGRERELETLLQIVEATAPGSGRLVLLAGRTGYGKSLLLGEARRQADSAEEADAPEVALVSCFKTGEGIPLSAIGDILGDLVRPDRRRLTARRVAEIVGDVSPLLGFVPIAGAPLAMGAKVASSVTLRSLGNDPQTEQAQRSADAARALVAIAERESALAVMVDDAQWLDEHSVDALLRVMRAMPDAPLTLVLAYDIDLQQEDAPLGALLAESAKSPGSVTRLTLDPFTVDDVGRLVETTFGSEVDANLAPWLTEAAEGNPLFADTYLRALQEQGVIRVANGRYELDGEIEGEPGEWSLSGRIRDLPEPTSLVELLRQRKTQLEEDELSVLESGSVQGRRFLTAILVRLLGEEERIVMDRLHRIQERSRVIAFDEAESWWTQGSDLVTFAPGAIRELFYERYRRSPRERRSVHKAVAEALDQLVAELPGEPPRRIRLEIADHYEEAGEGLEAATRLADIAEAMYAEGGAPEAEIQSERALRLLRGLQGPPDELLARTITVLLLSVELHWTSDQTVDGVPPQHLVAEAEAAASRVQDPALLADVLYTKGRLLMKFGRRERGLEAFRDARERSQEAKDPVGEAAALVEIGHYLDQQDLPAGRAELQNAYHLISGGALAAHVAPAQRELVEAHMESAIGVAEFDLGNYGAALPHLQSSPERLAKVRSLGLAGYAFTFRAQLYTAMGRFEAAEETLHDALALFEDEGRQLTVRGYVNGLLGHLYLEWDPRRTDEARSAILAGREELRATGDVSTQPLVDTYLTELLLVAADEASLREAEGVLDGAIKLSEQIGWPRGMIAGHSLQARVALGLGDHDRALALSEQATEALLAAPGGEIPVFRSEEILFTRTRVVKETGGDPSEWLAKARAKVDEKAATLKDPADRETFLTRVRLNRAIAAASG